MVSCECQVLLHCTVVVFKWSTPEVVSIRQLESGCCTLERNNGTMQEYLIFTCRHLLIYVLLYIDALFDAGQCLLVVNMPGGASKDEIYEGLDSYVL